MKHIDNTSAFTMMETRLELVPIKRSIDGPPRSKFCCINVGRDLVLIRSAYCRIHSHGPGLGRRWFNSAGSLAIVGCSGISVAPEVSQLYSETPQPPSVHSLFSKTFSFTSLDRASSPNDWNMSLGQMNILRPKASGVNDACWPQP